MERTCIAMRRRFKISSFYRIWHKLLSHVLQYLYLSPVFPHWNICLSKLSIPGKQMNNSTKRGTRIFCMYIGLPIINQPQFIKTGWYNEIPFTFRYHNKMLPTMWWVGLFSYSQYPWHWEEHFVSFCYDDKAITWKCLTIMSGRFMPHTR